MRTIAILTSLFLVCLGSLARAETTREAALRVILSVAKSDTIEGIANLGTEYRDKRCTDKLEKARKKVCIDSYNEMIRRRMKELTDLGQATEAINSNRPDRAKAITEALDRYNEANAETTRLIDELNNTFRVPK
ncbi:hypothetical protein HY971_03290 [Candidatus Kaiserbacteria bacterium]|nr:hypothetical protein [Candidatus Kaiserbacteria bacterium]